MEANIAIISQNLEPKEFPSVNHLQNQIHQYGLSPFVTALLKETNPNPTLLAEMIASYDPVNHVAEIQGRILNINKDSLAAALNLKTIHGGDVSEDYIRAVDLGDYDYARFLHEFVLTLMYLKPRTKLTEKIHKMRKCIINGHPRDFDFAGFMWLLVEEELLQGVNIKECYYYRHLQCLIRSQHSDLFNDPVDDDDDVVVLMDDVVDVAGRTSDDVGGSERRKSPAPNALEQVSLEHGAPELRNEERMVDSPQQQLLKKWKPRKRTKNPGEPGI